MANVMRKRWDLRRNPAHILEFAVDANIKVEIGDLGWLNTDDWRPASHTSLWTGSLAGTQGKLAEKFAGIAMSALDSTSAGTIRAAQRGVFAYPVASNTFEIGDLVGGARDGSNNNLLDQEVVKVSDESIAIGRVVKRYTTAVTTIEFEIATRFTAGGGNFTFRTS